MNACHQRRERFGLSPNGAQGSAQLILKELEPHSLLLRQIRARHLNRLEHLMEVEQEEVAGIVGCRRVRQAGTAVKSADDAGTSIVSRGVVRSTRRRSTITESVWSITPITLIACNRRSPAAEAAQDPGPPPRGVGRPAEGSGTPPPNTGPLAQVTSQGAIAEARRGGRRRQTAARAALIHEGEEGDRFYLIASGRLTATFQGAVLSQMGPGDPFGEIALLRDVPRTATVTADEASVLLALDRAAFLEAVTGDNEVSSRADDLIGRRIPTY